MGEIEIRYRRIGTGTPIVLLHTLRTQLEYFDRLVAQLDTTRFEVVASDLVGHGRSSAPRADYTAELFTDAVEKLLDNLALNGAILSGDSIGGAIALGVAARGNRRIKKVVAVNPYDYGQGARRSSRLGKAVFTAVLWPGIGPVVARAETRPLLRRLLQGGLHDHDALTPDLLETIYTSGRLPGHPYAFRSLNRNWSSWVEARNRYRSITAPVTLVYGDEDWSSPAEREANRVAIAGAQTIVLRECGHFASLDKPNEIGRLLSSET